jgi:hypothetical protein
MCGCDEIVAGYDSSFIFCHPWDVAYGDADAMHKAAKDLEMITKPIVSVYKAQTRDKLTEKDDIAGAFEKGQDSSLRCLGLRLELIQQ